MAYYYNDSDNLEVYKDIALTTKNLKLRKTDLWTQRYESLTPNMKDLHPKTETSKDVCYKDIALRDIVP
jgi:hypothetical protein